MLAYELPGTLESLDFLTPALWDAGARGLEERDGAVLAYFEAPVELPFGGRWITVEEEDWLEQFRATLGPVTIGNVTIVPSWRRGEAPSGGIVLELDPGMAFGTGHHETTRLAIRALTRLPLALRRVLDVGAGSGVLAIVAARLGARAQGVDNDPATLAVAEENAARNSVAASFTAGTLESVLEGNEGSYDVVVANLYAELHDRLMGSYREALASDGRLVLTGILAGVGRADEGEAAEWATSGGREGLVRAALEREGLALVNREAEGEWVLLEARKPA